MITRNTRTRKDTLSLTARFLLVAALAAYAALSSAESGSLGADEVAVEVSVDRSVITIGDYIRYQVRIMAGENVRIPRARFHPDLQQFEILDFSLAEKPSEENGRRVWEDEYLISTYTTGEYEIPPYRVKYRLGAEEDDGAAELEASSGSIRIDVKSVTPEESEAADIEDIKSPVPIPRPSRWWILFLVGIGIAGAVCGVLAYLRFGRKRWKEVGPPPLPPHELALLELGSLRKSEIVMDGRVEEFSVAVSAVIRKYIEGRFGIPALERTTEETLEAMEDHPLAVQHTEAVKHFFDSCDLVKFGGDLFRWSDLHVVIDEAEELVRQTMPAPEVAPTSETDRGKSGAAAE